MAHRDCHDRLAFARQLDGRIGNIGRSARRRRARLERALQRHRRDAATLECLGAVTGCRNGKANRVLIRDDRSATI